MGILNSERLPLKSGALTGPLQEQGIAIKKQYNLTVDPDFNGGYMGGQQLMALDSPPTAVFVSGDQMAVGVYRAIQEAGKNHSR